MMKNTFSHKVIAVFLTLTFLQSLIPYNMLQASNNGPNAPEAGAFEPVDATDMVNLLTGDFTYVLPLLNIPSPEGGYPIALSYHAGIAMDQEASWTGLGWNLNPGALNRSINGFPDDYKKSTISEFFYDEGDSETFYSISVGYGAPGGMFSTGLGFSWGSNLGLVGTVSLNAGIEGVGGIGFTASSNGDFSINAGYVSNSGLALGVSVGTNGVGGSVGFNNNGTGFSIGAHSNGTVSLGIDVATKTNNSLGLNFTKTSEGIGISGSIINRDDMGKVVGGGGVGMNFAFSNSINSGDYIIKQSSWTIPIMIPTQVGVFSASFSKQKIEWYLNKRETNTVTGPLFFNDENTYSLLCEYALSNNSNYHDIYFWGPCNIVETPEISATGRSKSVSRDNMDIYEFPVASEEFQDAKLDANNATFPSYDNYTVNAQGISGGIAPKLLENGTLFGRRTNLEGKDITYSLGNEDYNYDSNPQYAFNDRPEFYFTNEFSTYTEVPPATFNTDENSFITDYSNHTNDEFALSRRKTSKFIEYFTNEEILDHGTEIQQKGYLKPGSTDIDRTPYPEDGIGAFKVTGTNGKTYHYSLPVYNHEIITRTYGAINNKPESDSYFEKQQMEPYATHWLLTAVTGPDYIDKNNNGYADKEDYGYWVAFEYGMWSDAYVWKAPYGEEHIVSDENANIKTRHIGRKQLYYLNEITTRTHKALFVKSLRADNRSYPWTYKSVQWAGQQNSGDFDTQFTIPAQAPLKLDKIILINNASIPNVSTSSGNLLPDSNASVAIHYPSGKNTTAFYNLEDNILDVSDNWQSAYDHAIKVINFNYKSPEASLAKGTPHTENSNYGRLTLDNVSFAGKEGVVTIPPYAFEYNTSNYTFNIEDKGNWGYHKTHPEIWSLNKIITPHGGRIEIDYESHSVRSAVNTEILFKNTSNNGYSIISEGNNIYTISGKDNFEIQVGDTLEFRHERICSANVGQGEGHIPIDCNYSETAIVTQSLGNNAFRIDVGSNGCEANYACIENILEKYEALYTVIRAIPNSGGIRVARITTTDGTNNYATAYEYGENKDGIGYVSYLPFAPELDKELPYSSELPAPKAMYEYVNVKNIDHLGNSQGHTQYHFNVLKEKEEDAIRFGNFFSITMQEENQYNEVAHKDVNIREITVEDNLASIGQVVDIQVFNQQGQLLSKTENTYFAEEDRPNHQGIVQESYQTYKEIDYDDDALTDKWLINSSTRRSYANALKSTTTTSGGFSYSTHFDVYDPVTGTTTETTTYNSTGVAFKTKTVPAYTKYPEMGSKVDDPAYKNMLSQQTASYTYLKDTETGEWKETGVGITTWNDAWNYRKFDGTNETPQEDAEKIWRKHQTYIWEGELNDDGTFADFEDDFNWSFGAIQSSKWKKISEITRYDHYSTPLEVEDINANKVATKKDRYSESVIATANAGYDQIYYSGAEDPAMADRRFGGDVYRGDNTDIVSDNHTGRYAVQVDANEKAFAVIPQQTDKYRMSVWVNASNYSDTRAITPEGTYSYNEGEVVIAGEWVQVNFDIPVTAGHEVYVTTLAPTAKFDDFRVHPIGASMTAYVYNEWNEVSHILGANNLATYFEYDTAGRLIKTYAEVADFSEPGSGGFKLNKEYQYRYELVGEIDDDNDGVIDPEELYPPLGATFQPQNGYRSSGTLQVTPSGGSGQYEYRFGSGRVSGNNTRPQINAIPYGPITTNNSYYVSNPPCTGGSYGYQAKVVKIEVRDQVTGAVKEYQKTYNRTCPDENGQDEHGNHH